MTQEQLNMQRLDALYQGNLIRFARADDKKAIRAERLSVSAILRLPPRHWQSARIGELLMAMPRVGRQKASRWCKLTPVSLDRRLCEMPERQRFLLAQHVDVYVSRRDAIRRQLDG